MTTLPLFRQKSDCISKLNFKDFVWYHYHYYVYYWYFHDDLKRPFPEEVQDQFVIKSIQEKKLQEIMSAKSHLMKSSHWFYWSLLPLNFGIPAKLIWIFTTSSIKKTPCTKKISTLFQDNLSKSKSKVDLSYYWRLLRKRLKFLNSLFIHRNQNDNKKAFLNVTIVSRKQMKHRTSCDFKVNFEHVDAFQFCSSNQRPIFFK